MTKPIDKHLFMTVNELRTEHGLQPIPGGDVLTTVMHQTNSTFRLQYEDTPPLVVVVRNLYRPLMHVFKDGVQVKDITTFNMTAKLGEPITYNLGRHNDEEGTP